MFGWEIDRNHLLSTKIMVSCKRIIPIGSMYGIFTYIWVIFGVNVGKYSIHGAYGHGDLWKLKRVALLNLRRMAHGVTVEDDWLVHQIWVIQRPIPGKNPWPSSCLSSLYTQWSSDDS